MTTASAPPRRGAEDGPLAALARAAFRSRGRVLVGWVLAAALAFAASSAFGGEFSADYSAPGSGSAIAHELLAEAVPGQSGESITVVAHADGGLAEPATRGRVDAVLARVADASHVATVQDPWTTPGAVSADGRTVAVRIGLDVALASELPVEDGTALLDLLAEADGDGLVLAAGGEVVRLAEAGHVGSEALGVAAAAVILLLTFGTVVAAGLPILIALAGLAVSSMLTVLVAAALPVPDWSTSLVAMMGLGIGIDYALLMVTRFREWREHGLDVEDATVATLDTAGRAVLLAGTTVIISMLGLFGMGLSFMRGAALVTIVGVLLVLVAAMTLFPAVLGYLGGRLDRLRVPLPRRRGRGAPGAGWLRWSALVQRRRHVAALLGVGVMVALASPFLGVQFGSPDAGTSAPGSSARTAYDLTAQGYGPGANGPLLVVVRDASPASLDRLVPALTATEGVVSVSPPVVGEGAAVLTVVPATGPQDSRTSELVERLRSEVLPTAVAGTGARGFVGGATAATIDSDANVARRIPVLVVAVVGLSTLLLLVAFRSVAIAVKAAVLNLLSVAAAYGVVAHVLQGGWAGGLVGIDEPTVLPAFVPVLMFAVLFSLSADYEIFLVARMRDAYARTADTGAAIVHGLASTARVITAAAAIMVAVFAAFVPSPDIGVKVIGIGMAAAILLDATVVRLLLVPALMHLLGERNWWLPGWLDRLLPRLSVEGRESDHLRAAPAPERERELVGA
jgi:RND superfamily putative drug exporter